MLNCHRNFRSLFIAMYLTAAGAAGMAATGADELSDLGQALFFDTDLSALRNQACATCHKPGFAFADGRKSGVAGAVSLGDDGLSIGDRNAPSILYTDQVPEFHRNDDGDYVGGFFLDGRSATMQDQAAEPFFNPLEMAMPDRKAVVDRIRDNPGYVASFKALFGEEILADDEKAFEGVVESIVAFERSEQFSPFDSKYDRYLRGEYQMTDEEEVGRLLFFSQLVGCHGCHLLDKRESTRGETFSNHKYHNIGVPVNVAVRKKNGLGVAYRDLGLFKNEQVDDIAQAGKFRVPSLRNVAVTGPYMHNGVFGELRTAILFYDKYLVSNRVSDINPETGDRWRDPEVVQNIDLELLQQGQPITESGADALAAFLRTLTDARYESLLSD
jgi:cytochrome c peroxidase